MKGAGNKALLLVTTSAEGAEKLTIICSAVVLNGPYARPKK